MLKNPSLSLLHPLTQKLLSWYRASARDLPWRNSPEPYSTWLSEVIMQQTRVAQGTAYWERFLAEFPTVSDLAAAPTDEVMALWKGLGYYSRARNLHQAAQHIVSNHGGELPVKAEDWAKLPGIGPYTAAAIASICHGEAIPVIDGNVQRVMARLFDIPDAVDRKLGRSAVETACLELIAPQSPGDSNQAWMELGALICTPKSPDCEHCPLSEACLSRERETQLQRPVKQPKKAAKEVDVHFLIHVRKKGGKPVDWWVETRPDQGIWSQLEAFPCQMGPRTGTAPEGAFGPIDHILTHRRMTTWFQAVDSKVTPSKQSGGRWINIAEGEANWPRAIEKVLPELRSWIVKI
jgi:A/G-specific adenine glycosylase